ncbi:MAG: HAD family hydrolase [Acidimicrobiales bacterium]
MRSPVRLVATDLDGTLLDGSGRIDERSVAAVAAARQAGIHVVPVTGRPPQSLWPFCDVARLGPLGVCSNGAAVVDIDARRVLEVQALAGEIATGLVALVRQAVPDVLLAVDNLGRFTYEQGFLTISGPWADEVTEQGDVAGAVADGCLKLIARRPGWSALELIEMLEARIGEEGSVTTSGLDWVDIAAPGISKAYALERVCDRLGVSVDEVVAIGDNHNDLPVLAWAGTAMVPDNAVAEARALADRVLPDHGEGAVATLLEELVGGRAPG